MQIAQKSQRRRCLSLSCIMQNPSVDVDCNVSLQHFVWFQFYCCSFAGSIFFPFQLTDSRLIAVHLTGYIFIPVQLNASGLFAIHLTGSCFSPFHGLVVLLFLFIRLVLVLFFIPVHQTGFCFILVLLTDSCQIFIKQVLLFSVLKLLCHVQSC